MPFPSEWKRILEEERAKVPAGAPFSEYTKAAKRASTRYRAIKRGAVQYQARHTERNPKGSDWLLIGLLALGAWVLLQGMSKQQPS